MFLYLEAQLLAIAQSVPLEMFVVVASFIEEVIAPIPSPTVMVVSGSIASYQGYAASGLIILAILGAVGKTVGALVVYYVADKAENFVMHRFSRFFGVQAEDIEAFGKKLGNGPRDYFFLTFLRALPIMPSVVVSVGSGVLKVPLKVFFFSTFFGTIIRDGFYLYTGYVGTDIFTNLVQHSSSVESFVELFVFVLVGTGLLYLILRARKKNTTTT